ncbi:unnamed protein product [Closterium sp. NIES-54]
MRWQGGTVVGSISASSRLASRVATPTVRRNVGTPRCKGAFPSLTLSASLKVAGRKEDFSSSFKAQSEYEREKTLDAGMREAPMRQCGSAAVWQCGNAAITWKNGRRAGGIRGANLLH